jgi:diguanylate cyclase
VTDGFRAVHERVRNGSDKVTTTEDFERSISYGQAALSYLKGNQNPAYPRNYELWYTYAAGFNRELNKAVNEYLKRLGRITPEMTERLHDEFLSPVRLGDHVGQISGQVSSEINEIIELLESSGDNVKGYGASLRDAASGLEHASSSGQVRQIVEGMIAATSDMQGKNTELESQLRESRNQIKELQESLEAIRYESLNDQLTGLANRKHFDQSLEREAAAAQRRGEP